MDHKPVLNLKPALKRLLLDPFHDCLAALEKPMLSPRPGRAMILMIVALVVTWFVYVPIHELLHAYGCMVTGGTVTELQIDPKYGGKLLQPYFPFVKPGGAYAGRLTGFDTRGSDWIYLATDFGPFVLSVFPGVALLLLCRRRSRPLLLGAAVVLGLAPFYNITGDYYEMGSTITTRLWTLIAGTGDGKIAYEFVRSDDIFRWFGEFFSKRKEWGVTRLGTVTTMFLFLASLALSVILAFVTYAVGRVVGRLVVRNVGRGYVVSQTA